MKDFYGVKKYQVVDQNNVLQSSEHGMSFLELATYAGLPYEVAGLRDNTDPREAIVNKIMAEFDIEIPLLSWSGMELGELEAYYEELKTNAQQ